MQPWARMQQELEREGSLNRYTVVNLYTVFDRDQEASQEEARNYFEVQTPSEQLSWKR